MPASPSGAGITVRVGDRQLALDFPEPAGGADPAFEAAVVAALSPAPPPHLPGSRPASAAGVRPASRGDAAGADGADVRHVVKLAPRLQTAVVVPRPAPRPAGAAVAARAEEDAAAAAAEAAAAAAAAAGAPAPPAAPRPPMGPAGVPLAPEASIPRPIDVLSSAPALREKMEAEDTYDIAATAAAFERKGAPAPPASALARALLSGPGATPAAAAAQAERPVSASGVYFRLGENPVARERRLAALANQVLAAAKKGAGGAKKGKK
jgi:hypothetical protein